MKSKMNQRGHDEYDSSIDTEIGEGVEIQEKRKSKDEIKSIKKKLTINNKEVLTNIDRIENEKSDWNTVYSKFMSKIMDSSKIYQKELELRINAVLNLQIKKGSDLQNTLYGKNKYELSDKSKFVPVIMSKFNSFQPNGKVTKIKPQRNQIKKPPIIKEPSIKIDSRRKSLLNKDLMNKLSLVKQSSNTKLEDKRHSTPTSALKALKFAYPLDLRKTSLLEDNIFDYDRANDNFKPITESF
jgi:hypothetical protein